VGNPIDAISAIIACNWCYSLARNEGKNESKVENALWTTEIR